MEKTPAQVKDEFAARLVRLRTAREWEIPEAAAKLNISHWRLRKYEAAVNEPPLWLLIRMADLFEVPISFLVAGRKERAQPPELRVVNHRPKRA